MFILLSVLICLSLLTFGAVLPYSWLFLAILWVGSIAVYAIHAVLTKGRMSLLSLAFLVSGLILFGFALPKLAVGVFAAGWAYVAARDNEDGTLRFVRILVVVGVLEALLGLAQFFISPGWIFGYVNRYARLSGTLINRNHYAGLMEMLIPLTLGLAYIAVRRHHDFARSYVHVFAGALMGITLLFSLSRMGIFSFLLTVLFVSILLRLRDSRRRLATALGLGMVAFVLAGAAWIGVDVILARYMELAGQDATIQDARLLVFRDTIQMISANPMGVGTGQYQHQFRRYQYYRPDVVFDHAHNDYLEAAAEWGIPIAVVCWGIVIYVFVRAARAFGRERSVTQRGILLGCIGALFSILVHSMADFNLQIPSNAMLFFSLLGVAAAHSSRSVRSRAEARESS